MTKLASMWPGEPNIVGCHGYTCKDSLFCPSLLCSMSLHSLYLVIIQP